VSGRVREPGVKLAPAGITIQELIDEYCGGMQDGQKFYAYLPGGASGGILPASMNDIPLDFDTLQPYGCFIGSAAVVVLSDRTAPGAPRATRCASSRTSPAASARPAASAPPRRWPHGAAASGTSPLLGDLSQVMRDASICGLGQAAPNPSTASSSISRTNWLERVRNNMKASPVPNGRRSMRPPSPSTQRPRGRGLRHETLIEVADREGVEIPRLCYKEGMEAVGNCRSCMVEIDGERVLAPSCCRASEPRA
jgi:hypothetical protein